MHTHTLIMSPGAASLKKGKTNSKCLGYDTKKSGSKTLGNKENPFIAFISRSTFNRRFIDG